MNARILITDDDVVSCQLFAKVLEGEGYQVEWVQSGEEALTRLQDNAHDLLMVDVQMPGMSGLDVTRMVRQEYPALPVVVMTAFGSMETAIEAIREGAFDYISKPMNLEELKHTVSRALAQHALRDRSEEVGQGSETREETEAIIGRSPAMVEVYKTVARVAPTKSTVLILGESGTGKELIARALHQHSPRARRSFVAVDCGVLTETLLRVGGKEWITVDARVVAATNQNLTELVGKRAFRRDLYYRLHVITILLPPLRERAEDIPALAHGFLRRYSQEHGKDVTAIADEAMALLHSYSWPGNIRELENAIERAVALARQPILMPEDLPANVQEGVAPEWSHDLSQEEHSFFASSPTLDDVEKRYVQYVLSRTQGNVSHAAKILDIDRRSLYRMLERFKIAPFHKGA